VFFGGKGKLINFFTCKNVKFKQFSYIFLKISPSCVAYKGRARFLSMSGDLILTRAANLSGYLKSSLRLTDLTTNASWMHAPSSGRITRTASETYSRQGAGLLMSSRGILGWFFLLARCTCVYVYVLYLTCTSAGSRCPFESVYVYVRICVCECVSACESPCGSLRSFLIPSVPIIRQDRLRIYACTNDFWSKDGINKYI